MRWRRNTTPESQMAMAITAVISDGLWWIIYALRPSVWQLVVALILAAIAALQVMRSIRNPPGRGRAGEQDSSRPS